MEAEPSRDTVEEDSFSLKSVPHGAARRNTKNTSPFSALHRSAGDSSQASGIFNFGKMREGKRHTEIEREREAGRERERESSQTITGKRLLLPIQYKKQQIERLLCAQSWTR